MRIKLFVCLWALPILTLSADNQLPVTSALVSPVINFQQEFEEYIETVVAQDAPGLAVTVVIDGKSILTRGYGVAEIGGSSEINTETVFRLASVSKSLASAAVGSLVQSNKLQWDSKIADYLGDLRFENPQYAEELTLQHLLSHSTGLVPHAYTNLIEDNVRYKKILRKLDKVPFVCNPGACYGYQNVVFSLVGDIIELVSKETFESFVRRNLFDPLDMKTASYGMDNFVNNENRAIPHIWNYRDKQWVSVAVNDKYYRIAPAAGANASISDMNYWLLAQLGHYQGVLNLSTLNAMHGKHIKTNRDQAHYFGGNWQKLDGTYYGLGWRVFDYGDHENYVHHGGWVQGTRTEIVFHSKLQMGMVFLTNSETLYASELVPVFLQLYSKHILGE